MVICTACCKMIFVNIIRVNSFVSNLFYNCERCKDIGLSHLKCALTRHGCLKRLGYQFKAKFDDQTLLLGRYFHFLLFVIKPCLGFDHFGFISDN